MADELLLQRLPFQRTKARGRFSFVERHQAAPCLPNDAALRIRPAAVDAVRLGALHVPQCKCAARQVVVE
jgi:hypothetical protein